MDPGDVSLGSEERAAIRAFLQRSEVRLSTVHRVATALLSGAGLMVLLPAFARDSLVSVARTLLADDLDLVHVCLLVAMAALLVLPAVALWLLVRDLALFYFHAQHVQHDGSEVFTPRFTLTGLRVPADDVGGAARSDLASFRSAPETVGLLVPMTERARARIDRQLDAYGGLGRRDLVGDLGRARGLFELAASRDRSLLEEVAKVEHGMARHILRLQVIVLRYVKALLVFLATALAVFAAAGALSGVAAVEAPQALWLVCIVAAWAPSIVAVASAPVRWLEQLLRADGASRSGVGGDPELTKVERIAVWIAAASWAMVAVALVAVLAEGDADRAGGAAGVVVMALSGIWLLRQIVERSRSASMR